MRRSLCGIALLASSVLLSTALSAQKKLAEASKEKTSTLAGRVLAYVDSLVVGAGVGPQYETFIFGMELKNARGEQVVAPVKVAYAFFKSGGPLPASFFDHSKLYELRVVRDSNCDDRVSNLSYVKNEDETGKQLPPTYILRMMDGAPKDALKPDLVLPCYVLRSGNYRLRN
jgi:hypothetical protein